MMKIKLKNKIKLIITVLESILSGENENVRCFYDRLYKSHKYVSLHPVFPRSRF